ncbi:unnamed protein product [Polarella glacialis]|uniref:Uncharacterized protein n=1 Tax=Polarella glacialis TaxID=89957 RepID=A0A813DL31_POLGL|nr:unnamed protein product [Polarella glacialis]CAE8610825.1 unnamed protein product [Polarella glacialis]
MAARDQPKVCLAGLASLGELCQVLRPDELRPFCEVAVVQALGLLQDPGLCLDLRPAAVICLARLCFAFRNEAIGLVQSLDAFQALASTVVAASPCRFQVSSMRDPPSKFNSNNNSNAWSRREKDQQRDRCVLQRATDEWLHRQQLGEALLLAYALLAGLAAEQHMPGILAFVACSCSGLLGPEGQRSPGRSRREEETFRRCLEIFSALAQLHPDRVAAAARADRSVGLPLSRLLKFAESSSLKSDPQLQVCAQTIKRAASTAIGG